MGFWDTLKALFVHDAIKEAEVTAQQKSSKPTLADIIAEEKADEQRASRKNAPKYDQLEAQIEEAFNHLLDNTEEGITDLHMARLHYLKIINAMPIMIALENDAELISHDGQNMYAGIQRIFNTKVATATSFSGNELRKANKSWNDLYFELTGKGGTTELGDIWYDMIYLTPTGDESVQQMMTALFNKICEAADTIARMTGSDYKYSSIPDIVAQLSYCFETLMEISNSDEIDTYNQFNDALGEVDYTNLKLRVTTTAHPKIMAYFARAKVARS